ncbi:cob(I)yrinic acid a,c-diamide adenosyltransferase [Pectinatus sottacetonis]|uniref:cob(I)yrinic acid a,c-diamide adenosyltransferase n=1 Tax=Pectinatus sottacetonis TaxID=1002795 RepID=UPI0018C50932|nr:cob(I)yrinic acid a,c-diamide adenosyltransferase [Pectinatus sottacetonis]
MSISTKTGDKGETSLYTGQRVDKNSPRVEAYGSVDEINSALALARSVCQKEEVKKNIKFLQKLNMSLMTDLASINTQPIIRQKEVSMLEDLIHDIENRLPVLKEFIVPGNTLAGAFLDMARSTTRRAERRVLALAQKEVVFDQDRLYLNRLSDLCFLLMRLEEA